MFVRMNESLVEVLNHAHSMLGSASVGPLPLLTGPQPGERNQLGANINTFNENYAHSAEPTQRPLHSVMGGKGTVD